MHRKVKIFILSLIAIFLHASQVSMAWEGCEDLPFYYPLQIIWFEGVLKGEKGLKEAAAIYDRCCDCSAPWIKAMKTETKFIGTARSVRFEEVDVGGGETYNRIAAEFVKIIVKQGEPIATTNLKVESRIGPCNYLFETGKRYEVSVTPLSSDQSQTNKCLGIREIE
jgi:hypothetical protein